MITYWSPEQQHRPNSPATSSPIIRLTATYETEDELIKSLISGPVPDFIIPPPTSHPQAASTGGWMMRHILRQAGLEKVVCVGVWWGGVTKRERQAYYSHCIEEEYAIVIPTLLHAEGGRVFDRYRVVQDMRGMINREPSIYIVPEFDMEGDADRRAKEVINTLKGEWEVLLR